MPRVQAAAVAPALFEEAFTLWRATMQLTMHNVARLGSALPMTRYSIAEASSAAIDDTSRCRSERRHGADCGSHRCGFLYETDLIPRSRRHHARGEQEGSGRQTGNFHHFLPARTEDKFWASFSNVQPLV